jgi:hypothetical protein
MKWRAVSGLDGAGLARQWLDNLIFEGEAARRFTQDSPVLPDVWIRFGMRALGFDVDEHGGGDPAAVDLLVTPHRDFSAAELAKGIRDALKAFDGDATSRERARYDVAYTQSTVAVRLDLTRVCSVLVPMSGWWAETNRAGKVPDLLANLRDDEAKQGALANRLREIARLRGGSAPQATREGAGEPFGAGPAFVWMARVVGTIARAGRAPQTPPLFFPSILDELLERPEETIRAFLETMRPVRPHGRSVWTVSLNRRAKTTVSLSALAVKADAARTVFGIRCDKLAWAVLDTGIDAGHAAFTLRKNEPNGSTNSRVVETYDFTRVRELLADPGAASEATAGNSLPKERAVQSMRRRLRQGRAIDWGLLRSLLRVDHEQGYAPPVHDHGTHVAGILAGDYTDGETYVGICPDLRLYDLRVLDETGRGEEFAIIAALQFIRWMNEHHDQPKIHGVNLSLSLKHDVANYACGRTPICDECERTVASGVVVVTAAGNDGYTKLSTPTGDTEGYRSISISDPGNADSVITVGATHRNKPHTYGVSYFSSRGPTGDGRMKPDLVAPGEKITAPVPGTGVATKDGTSMAAPHVSGGAALLLARHRELLGQPRRVKEILCSTATDLRRERYFQGAGMLDILRALQSV